MKIIKKVLKGLFFIIIGIIGIILVFLAITIAPVDRTPAQQHASYFKTMEYLDSINEQATPLLRKKLSIGYGKVNLTPPFKTATAGYGKRKGKLYSAVHDSIYVRTMVVDNGLQRIAIVSADLLIIPPAVTQLLQVKLRDIGFSLDNTFLGATHTHNSIGNWSTGATQLIAAAIIKSITLATTNILPATLKCGAIPVPEIVTNRVIDNGKTDSLLRVLEVHRSDSLKLILMSYTAHATCLYSRDLELSRDYPGVLIDRLEANGYAFAMFMAGAVGSHGCNVPEFGWECVTFMADEIAKTFLSEKNTLHVVSDSALVMARVPLLLSDPQVKITKGLKVRSWFFRFALGEYPAYLTVLRIGDLVMLGTPCDFSGEFNAQLDASASVHGLTTMVTSFNGGYIGYLTPVAYYDIDHYETRIMNWYAPGTGEYVQACLKKLILEVAD
jgi:neutral ceramidase